MKIISKEGKEITERFFIAIQYLKEQRKIRGIEDFANRYGLSQSYLSDIKSHTDSRSIKVEYIMYLVRDFDISPTWILIGVGNILT